MHPAYVFGCNDEAPDFSPELHARIIQAVSYTPAVTLSAADAQYDDGKTSRANWRQLTGLAMTLAAIVLIAFCSPWRPFTFDSQFPPQAAAPAVPVSAQANLIGDTNIEEPQAEDALAQLSTVTSLATDQIVTMVAEQAVLERHWELWNEDAHVLGDTLLDPLPNSWVASLALEDNQ